MLSFYFPLFWILLWQNRRLCFIEIHRPLRPGLGVLSFRMVTRVVTPDPDWEPLMQRVHMYSRSIRVTVPSTWNCLWFVSQQLWNSVEFPNQPPSITRSFHISETDCDVFMVWPYDDIMKGLYWLCHCLLLTSLSYRCSLPSVTVISYVWFPLSCVISCEGFFLHPLQAWLITMWTSKIPEACTFVNYTVVAMSVNQNFTCKQYITNCCTV